MTVEPGFGGQKFMSHCMPKVQELRRLRPHLNIQVDGGLNPATTKQAAASGANMIVAGSSVFKSTDIKATMDDMRASVNGSIGTTEENTKATVTEQ